MSIPETQRENFNQIKRASEYGSLCLVESEYKSGGPAYVICIAIEDIDDSVVMFPVAEMLMSVEHIKVPEGADNVREESNDGSAQ